MRFLIMAEIRPQAGQQEAFLATAADIAIYGGAAGGGKSFALLLEPLRHVTTNPNFSAVIFRRNATQVRNVGSLWDESLKLYSQLKATPVQVPMEWNFSGGGRVKFAHLEYDTTVLEWQGSQIPLIGFDELTHFSESQFWYMLSRNRSMSGVAGYVRATTNPDADSWVAKLIAWWIDQASGLPIVERSGVVRWFVRVNDTLMWGDSAAELLDKHGDAVIPKSFTFIPAKLSDNKILMQNDPSYLANLLALGEVERGRLLDGNWKIRPAAGLYFKAEWLENEFSVAPAHLRIFMCSDYAVSDGRGDYTEHGVFGVDSKDRIYVLDWWYGQHTPDVWIETGLDMVKKHKPTIWAGESGVIRNAIEPLLRRRMRDRGDYVELDWLPSITDKASRSRGFQARVAALMVYLPRHTEWATRLKNQLVAFDNSKNGKDDAVDVCSLLGRMLDRVRAASDTPQQQPKPVEHSIDWLLQETTEKKPRSQYLR